MSTNTQLQKITPARPRRIRHRTRLIAGSPRVEGRHPALDNFLIPEAARANALGGLTRLTRAQLRAAVHAPGCEAHRGRRCPGVAAKIRTAGASMRLTGVEQARHKFICRRV